MLPLSLSCQQTRLLPQNGQGFGSGTSSIVCYLVHRCAAMRAIAVKHCKRAKHFLCAVVTLFAHAALRHVACVLRVNPVRVYHWRNVSRRHIIYSLIHRLFNADAQLRKCSNLRLFPDTHLQVPQATHQHRTRGRSSQTSPFPQPFA